MWNEKYIQYLGIEPDSYSSGVLQDIHWAQGSFGYFPTYSLGSLYAAQFFHFMKKEIPSFTKDIENGDFTLILNWLRKNIHIHGRLFTASELCINATGEKLSSAYFKEYIGEKLSQVYNVDL
jgi:carboxypeptidase Taq